MNGKFKTLAGGVAVAGLVIAGSVAASAVDAVKVEKVGYFEVQGDENLTPAGWFSEGDDGIDAISFNLDSVVFAADSKAVGIHKIVDAALDTSVRVAIEAEGSASYTMVLKSDDVNYLRITAVGNVVDEWQAVQYYDADGDKVSLGGTRTQSLDAWAAEDFLDSNPVVHQIGARHHTGQGLGSVETLGFNGTTYDFGLIKDVTPFDQADLDAAAAAAKAEFDGWKSPADYAAALAQVPADAKAELDALKTKVAELEGDLAKAEKAAAKSANQALAAQARAPYRITGKAKTGNTLRAKGKSYKGVTVKYQWYVGGKKAGKKATLKLKKANANKKVRVVVTKSFTRANGKTVNVKQNVKLTSVTRVAR